MKTKQKSRREISAAAPLNGARQKPERERVPRKLASRTRSAAPHAVAVQRPRAAHRMVEDVVGCKWSLTVLGMVRAGVCRPGSMTRQVPGLSPKVLNERLRKLARYGVISRKVFPEVPPHVEYRLTPFGRRFAVVLDRVD